MTKVKFPEIDPKSFQHPLDSSATAALAKVPGIDWLLRRILMAFGEKRMRLLFLASAIRGDENQFGDLHASYKEACDILGIADPPELFVAQNPSVNAAAIGVDKPFIVANSSLTTMMTREEMQCVLAHELGHVMCGHALYTTSLIFLLRLWDVFLGIPGGAIALFGIRAALLEWSRKAELSADRAGLLVTQDLETAMRVDMKLAGGKQAGELPIEGILKQAEEYESGGDVVDGVLKMSMLMDTTHPFPVVRISELKKWHDQGQYQEILAGNYEKSSEPMNDSFISQIRSTIDQYRQEAGKTEDTLIAALRDLSSGAVATGSEILSFFNKQK